MSARVIAIATVLAATMVVGACSTPTNTRYVATPPPNDASFRGVAQVLVHHCGSLDCHGTPQRNLRIYGNEGLRRAAGDVPYFRRDAGSDDAGVHGTSDAEINEDYLSIIALEPELISAVFAEGGARPERLTLVRKARGQEAHKGDAPIKQGDDSDTCITSWLAGKPDTAACTRGLTP